jgi:hypothetical protein
MEFKLKRQGFLFLFLCVMAMSHSQTPAAECQYKKGVKDFLPRIDCRAIQLPERKILTENLARWHQ